VARKERDRIQEQDITGLKYFDRLAPLLERLRDVGCERDRAGNRELHYDQYCLLVLLYLFNPIVTSLRGIPFPFPNVPRPVGVGRESPARRRQRRFACQSPCRAPAIGIGLTGGTSVDFASRPDAKCCSMASKSVACPGLAVHALSLSARRLLPAACRTSRMPCRPRFGTASAPRDSQYAPLDQSIASAFAVPRGISSARRA
jgi:hypothetical protein